MTDSVVDGSARPDRWPAATAPIGDTGWIGRATEFADLIARADEVSLAERVAMAKEAGLVTVLGPAEHGGGGQSWYVAHQTVRLVAAADAVLGRILAQHYVWVRLAAFIGTEEKIEHIGEVAARAKWLFSGAARVREATLAIADAGDMMIFNGEIAPSVGHQVSDITILEGLREGSEVPISALAMSYEPGLRLVAEENQAVVVDNVAIPWSGALGHVDKTFQPRPYNAFITPTLVLALANVHLGIARGRLARLRRSLPPELAAPDPWYSAAGELISSLWAAEALTDSAIRTAEPMHREREAVTGRDRGAYQAAATAAALRAKAVSEEISAAVPGVLGSGVMPPDRPTSEQDTPYTAQDEVFYRGQDLARRVLAGVEAEPTWFS